MSVTLEQFGLDRLPSGDRRELMELLWDSLQDGSYSPPAWHLEELERRIAAADANPEAGVPWEEFRDKWLNRS